MVKETQHWCPYRLLVSAYVQITVAPQAFHIDTPVSLILEKSLLWGREAFVHYLQLKQSFMSLLRMPKGLIKIAERDLIPIPLPSQFEVMTCFYCCFIHFIISCVWKASMFGLSVILHSKIPSLEVILSRRLPYCVDWPWKKGMCGGGSKCLAF